MKVKMTKEKEIKLPRIDEGFSNSGECILMNSKHHISCRGIHCEECIMQYKNYNLLIEQEREWEK